MSTETLPQALTAGTVAQFGAGTKFLIFSSIAAVNVTAIQLGSGNKRIVLNGCLQGFSYDGETDGGFDLLQITSAEDQPNFVIVVGDDKVSYPATVSVSGSVNTEDIPAEVLTDIPPVACANAEQTAVVPQNAARRRVTLGIDPAAGGVVYARKSGGVNSLLPMQPGMSYEFRGTYGIDVRNDSGAAVNVYVLEES